MTKLGIAIAFIAVALLASTTYGRVERQPTPAQVAPLEMMSGQHLPQTEMTDFSLVFCCWLT